MQWWILLNPIFPLPSPSSWLLPKTKIWSCPIQLQNLLRYGIPSIWPTGVRTAQPQATSLPPLGCLGPTILILSQLLLQFLCIPLPVHTLCPLSTWSPVPLWGKLLRVKLASGAASYFLLSLTAVGRSYWLFISRLPFWIKLLYLCVLCAHHEIKGVEAACGAEGLLTSH